MLANAVAVKAPYATTAIPLHLSSLTGTRYRSLNCLECGQEFIERNNGSLYRSNDPSQPYEIAISGESVMAICGNCTQMYRINISLNVGLTADSMSLHLQPESMYIAIESTKRLRYIHCMECGKAFHSISDRVSQVIDNRVPFEYVDASRLGPLEALCHYNRCGQTWALIV